MAILKDFEPYVMLDVLGCPTPVARQALTLSVIDFCRRSRVWREDCDAGLTASGVSLYPVTLPADSALTSILDVMLDGRLLTKGCYALEAGSVRASAALPAGRVMTVRALLAPLPAATTYPDLLLDYAEGIASGTKYRLMIQANKPWSQPELAVAHKGLYDAAINDAFARAESSGVVSATFAAPVRFGY